MPIGNWERILSNLLFIEIYRLREEGNGGKTNRKSHVKADAPTVKGARHLTTRSFVTREASRTISSNEGEACSGGQILRCAAYDGHARGKVEGQKG